MYICIENSNGVMHPEQETRFLDRSPFLWSAQVIRFPPTSTDGNRCRTATWISEWISWMGSGELTCTNGWRKHTRQKSKNFQLLLACVR